MRPTLPPIVPTKVLLVVELTCLEALRISLADRVHEVVLLHGALLCCDIISNWTVDQFNEDGTQVFHTGFFVVGKLLNGANIRGQSILTTLRIANANARALA